MKLFKSVAAVLCACLLLGQAGVRADDEPVYSGFLGDYSGFAADNGDRMLYRKPGVTFEYLKNFDQLLIDPVIVWAHPAAEFKRIRAEDKEKIANYFTEALVREFSGAYGVTDSPGDRVLRVRAAITGVVPADPKKRLVQFTPIGLAFTGVGKVKDKVKGEEDLQMQAWMEAELIDSGNNERLFAIVDRGAGKKVQVAEGEDANWKSIRAALDDWASGLKERFDEAHGRKP